MGVGGHFGIAFQTNRFRKPKYQDIGGAQFLIEPYVSGKVAFDGSNNVTSVIDSIAAATASPVSTARPLWVASANDSRPCVRANGTTNTLSFASPSLPAPSTSTNVVVYGVASFGTIGSFDCIFTAGSSTIYQVAINNANAVNHSMQMSNGVNGPNSASFNGYVRFWAVFTGTTADQLKVGSDAVVTGANAGNTPPSPGINIFSRGGSANTFIAADLYMLGVWTGVLTNTQLVYLDNVTASLFPTVAR